MTICKNDLWAFAACLRREERSSGTVEKYRRDAAAFAAWLGCCELTRETAARWRDHLLREGYALTVPLAGLLPLHQLLEELRLHEEIPEAELPEDFKWLDHEHAQAICWGLQEHLVADTEEEPLDPDAVITVALMRDVLVNYVELYLGLDDFVVTLRGRTARWSWTLACGWLLSTRSWKPRRQTKRPNLPQIQLQRPRRHLPPGPFPSQPQAFSPGVEELRFCSR